MIRAFVPILLGFVLWSVAFVGLYALQGLGCAWGWLPSLHRSLLIFGYVLTLVSLGGAAFWQATNRPRSLSQRVGLVLTVCALVASAIIFGPVFFATLCV